MAAEPGSSLLMGRVISPPTSAFPGLREPLTPGLRAVVDFFTRYLPNGWEIYTRPYLNGLRPGVVLLNPHAGIAAYRVVESLAERELLSEVGNYRREIHELYCPRTETRSGIAAVTSGIIFPHHGREEVLRVYPLLETNKGYSRVAYRENLTAPTAEEILPDSARYSSRLMSPDLAQDFRSWLTEPDFAVQGREPVVLDARQRVLVRSRTESGYRRIRGPAGSGKSQLLAARAAEVARQPGANVLVVTYNLTLLNFLRELAERYARGSSNSITWLNFHTWCRRIAYVTGNEERYLDLWRALRDEEEDSTSQILAESLPELIIEILERQGHLVEKYDAILVDEGQDFHLGWWRALRGAIKPDREMILVADATQDVYGSARAWTDEAMLGAGFAGPWVQLETSYRMPPGLLPIVSSFARRFLSQSDLPAPPAQGELDLFPCHLRWVQTTQEQLMARTAGEMATMLYHCDPNLLAIPDFCVLVDRVATGLELVGLLNRRGIRVVDTFGERNEERRKKLHFTWGDGQVRVTTLHSFKGWERRAVLLVIGSARGPRQLAAIYAGLTRLSRHEQQSFLTVVCAAPELAEFGRTWPDYAD